MQRLQGIIYWVCITSEITHFFCCGLPVVFSVLSLLASMGVMAAMPVGLDGLHHAMHDYEIPMIMASALILVLGWGLHYVAYLIDCRSHGCSHEPCTPKKKRSGKVLMVATALFALNLVGYFTFHG